MFLLPLSTVALLFAVPSSALQTGDIVLHTSRSQQSAAIQKATASPYSHVGLVEVTKEGIFVIEAVQPVSRTPWKTWRARGEAGRDLVVRPRGRDPARAAKAVAEARRHVGKPYDLLFAWGDDALYCSELVYKAYAAAGLELGVLQRLESLAVRGLEAELVERYGGDIPRDLLVVTPASIAADEDVVVVATSY